METATAYLPPGIPEVPKGNNESGKGIRANYHMIRSINSHYYLRIYPKRNALNSKNYAPIPSDYLLKEPQTDNRRAIAALAVYRLFQNKRRHASIIQTSDTTARTQPRVLECIPVVTPQELDLDNKNTVSQKQKKKRTIFPRHISHRRK